MKIVIPARFHSSRLEGKPLLKLSGKAMILHVVDRCLEAGFSSEDVIVATDDTRINNVLNTAGVRTILTSTEHSSGTDRVNEVVQLLKLKDEEIIINVQGDEPLIPPRLIRKVAEFAQNNLEFDIVTAVTRINTLSEFNDRNVVKAILGSAGRALYFSRSSAPMNRDNPDDFSMSHRHIGIYAYRVAKLRCFCELPPAPLEAHEKLEQLRALSHGLTVGATIYDGEVPHGVDTQADFELVSKLFHLTDA